MSKKESVPNRQYTEEFKVEAVRLADSIGGNAAAKRLGVPQSTVTNWVRNRKLGGRDQRPSRRSRPRLPEGRYRSWRRRTPGSARSWSVPSWTWRS
jgi:transposase-like protein